MRVVREPGDAERLEAAMRRHPTYLHAQRREQSQRLAPVIDIRTGQEIDR